MRFFISVIASQQVNRLTIVVLSILYGVLAIWQIARHFRKAVRVTKDGTITPFEKLADEPPSPD